MSRKNEAAAVALPNEETQPQTTALAPAGQSALEAMADEFDFSNDGLDAASKEDLRLPVIVWNLKGRDERTNKMRSTDEFYDTLNEVYHKTIRCAFIHLVKSNSFARFDETRNETIIHCTSYDQKEGRLRTKHPDIPTLEEGVVRPCATCPDFQWRKDSKGKNVRNCNPVYGVFSVMLDDDLRPTDGFLIRFKKTSLQPFQQHMQRHHLGKRRVGNEMKNWPLWVFEANLRLEVDKNGNFAVPVIEKGRDLPRETLAVLSEQLKFFKEVDVEATQAAEKQESRHEAAIDTTGTSSGGGVTAEDFAVG